MRIFWNVSNAKWAELGPCSGVSFSGCVGVIGGNRSITVHMWGDFTEDGIGRGAPSGSQPFEQKTYLSCSSFHSEDTN